MINIESAWWGFKTAEKVFFLQEINQLGDSQCGCLEIHVLIQFS